VVRAKEEAVEGQASVLRRTNEGENFASKRDKTTKLRRQTGAGKRVTREC